MHDHSQCDHHHPASYNLAFIVGIALNSAFVLAEFSAGFMTRSLALLADAGHNLADVLGLLMGWSAVLLALRPPTEMRTYGFRRTTILAAFANASLLTLIVGAIGWEAIQRLSEPIKVPGTAIFLVALVGIAVNGGTALMFVRGNQDDLNIRGAYLHMATDALVAFGVVVAGLAIRATGLAWIDSAASLGIAVLIGFGTWKLLRRSLDLVLDAVPPGVDPAAVRAYLQSLPGVEGVSDLHIWAMSTTETALTAHLVVPDPWPKDRLAEVARELCDRYKIIHSTVQVDQAPSTGCPLSV